MTASDKRFGKKHAEQKSQLAQVEADIVLLERQLASSAKRITPELIDRFGALLRKGFREGDPALRKYYVRALLDNVEVGDAEIRISGSKKALEHAIGRVETPNRSVVPIIERKWCTRQDSNL